MKKLLLFALCMVYAVEAYSQDTADEKVSSWGKSKSYVENIVPLAPNAAQAARYADCPVSYSLGLADISIPLYTVVGRELSLPISLSYHGGGIRVEEVAGVAGLGWNLNAGGVITREISGMPDEYRTKNGYEDFFKMITPAQLKNNLSMDPKGGAYADFMLYFRDIVLNRKEAGYDKYNYNFCGQSGSFIIARTGSSPQVKEIQVNDFKIEFTSNLSYFTITGNDGTKYIFNEHETVHKHTTGTIGDQYRYDYTNAWYLTKIVSFNGTDEIKLNYSSTNEWKKTMRSTTASVTSTEEPASAKGNISDENVKDAAPVDRNQLNFSKSEIRFTYKPKVLSSIEFSGGSVTFSYDNESQQIQRDGSDFSPSVYTNFPKKLTRIVVRNTSSDIIKDVLFSLDIFNDKRIRLAGLEIKSGTLTDDKYTFGYYDNPNLSSTINHFSQDFFGFYNGETDNHSLNPIQDINDFLTPKFTRRLYSFKHARTYALKHIVQNKVRTEFEYEANTGTPAVLWDTVRIGLRIRSIATYNNTKLVKKRIFEYDRDSVKSTIDFSRVHKNFYASRSGNKQLHNPNNLLEGDDLILNVSMMERSCVPGAAPEGARICYERVTETVYGGDEKLSSTQRVKTDYIYDCKLDTNQLVSTRETLRTCRQSIDAHFNTATLVGSGGANSSGSIGEVEFYFKDRPQYFNNLIQKITYKTNPNGHYEVVHREVNTYQRFTADPVVTDFIVRHPGPGGKSGDRDLATTANAGVAPQLEKPVGNEQSNADNAKYFYYFHVQTDAANSSRIAQTEQIDYLTVGEFRTKKKYQYYPSISRSGWPFSPSVPPIGGEYPIEDFHPDPGTGTPPEQEPFDSNLLHRDETVSGNTSYVHNYLYTDTYKTLPVYKKMFDLNNLSAYTGEELLKMGKTEKGLLKTIYRKGKYVHYEEVSIAGQTLILPTKVVSRVGDETVWEQDILRYNEKGNILEARENGLPSTCYLWSYNYTYPVAQIRNATYQQVEQALGGEAAVRQIAQSGTLSDEHYAQLNTLRTALPGALVAVFRHIPLVGVSDITDPSGRTIYYKYDGAWRLQLVCDDQGEPVESYEYFKPSVQ